MKSLRELLGIKPAVARTEGKGVMPFCNGENEKARRRRQIEQYKLRPANGLVRET